MTPELISRVDAVLAPWCPDSPLAHLWWQLAATWLTQSGEDRCAAGAAMRGVLLALVREAWGDPHANTDATIVQGVWVWWVHVPSRRPGNVDDTIAGRGDTEDAALVVALEAAPEVPG